MKPALRDNVRHLSRKLQHQLGEQQLPADLLQPGHIDTKFAGHVGFPEAGDSIAYEPVQSLLAVGTSDGRVKLIGKPGVEVTLRSTSRSPTKYLGFLPNKGAVLRVTQDGDIQLFSVVAKKLLTSTWLQGDAINAVALLPDDPYLLLGCESGNVRVVALLDEQDRPAEGARQAADLSLQPYQVLSHDLDASGPVVSLDVAQLRGRPLMVVVHKNSGALVWDIRAEKLVAAALDDENEVSKPTAVCWVGERANCFAVGYDDGSILLYGVPKEALAEDPLKVSAPADAQLLMTFRLAPLGARAAPVKSLTFVAGERGEDWLLVLGGQPAEEPDMLTQLPLAQRPAGRPLPWFGNIKGHALVPSQGSLNANDNPGAVMVLTEGGQLVIHDLAAWQPVPLTLPFQELSPISVAKIVPTVNLSLLGLSPDPTDLPQPSPGSAYSGRSGRSARTSEPARPGAPAAQHALTLDKLRRAARRSGAGAGGAWPLHGGETAPSWASGLGSAGGGDAAAAGAGAGAAGPPPGRHPSALYFTGHRDGRVRVWDATSRVPVLMLAMPAAAGQERLRPVTALEVCPFSGLVLVGHAGGEVRLYQFTDSKQTVHRMNLDESGVPYDNVAAQPAGFQYVMRFGIHSADVCAVHLATKLKLAAVADESGVVSVLDLMQPALLWTTRALPRPVRHLVLGCHIVPAARDKGAAASSSSDQPVAGTERLVLFAAGDDSTLLMLSLERGEVLEKPLRPKNASRPLAMALLDANGTPVPPCQGPMTLPWANNNAPPPASAFEDAEPPELEVQQSMRALSIDLPSTLSPRPSGGGAALPAGLALRASMSAGLESVRGAVGGVVGGLLPSRSATAEPPESSTGDSLELRELPSDDEADGQAAGAQAPSPGSMTEAARLQQAQQGKGKKFKLPKGFLRPGSKRAQSVEADLPSPQQQQPTSPVPPSPSGSREATSPQGSLGVELPPPEEALLDAPLPSPSPRPLSPRDEAIGSPTLNLTTPERGAAPPPAPAPLRQQSADYLVDYPYLVDAEPQPALYLLLCCQDYLRVYSTENVRLGDRSTERKATEETPLVFAGVFMSVHGPGVATVAQDGALAVRTVPGLDCIYRLRLDHSNVLGFRWGVGHDAAVAATAAAACACSLDGQLVLAGPSNEIARLTVVRDCVEPLAAVSAYDLVLAEAASSALRTAAAAAAARAASQDYVLREAPPPVATQQPAAEGAGSSSLDSPHADKRGSGKALGRFFHSVKGTASAVVETAGKTAQSAMQATMEGLDKGFKGLASSVSADASSGPQQAQQQRRRELPTLTALFATPVEPVDATDDIDYMTDDDTAAGAAPELSPRAPGGASEPAASGGKATGVGGGLGSLSMGALAGKLRRGGSDKDSQRKERGELMQAAPAPSPRAKPDFKTGGGKHMRTASAVREAYGRPRHTERAQQVRSIMEQNKQRLQERGEKLQDLEQRTAQMQNDAADFASLARQLEDHYSNRKWWQL